MHHLKLSNKNRGIGKFTFSFALMQRKQSRKFVGTRKTRSLRAFFRANARQKPGAGKLLVHIVGSFLIFLELPN